LACWRWHWDCAETVLSGRFQAWLAASGHGLPAPAIPWRGSGLTARCGHHRSGRTELGADLFAVGMLDLVEDRHRLPPRPAGGPDVTGAVVDVAEAGERIGLVEPVGEVTGERDGPLVAHDGLVVVAPLVMGVAEAVPDGALPVPFPHLPH